jgi:hypothetical protein
MRSQYSWRYHGDAVQIQLGKITEQKSIMLHTLPALWNRCGQKRSDADVVCVDSPPQKKTRPNEEMPRSKEQQVLADCVAATLEKMRCASADALPADRKRVYVDLLEAAALDVLDASQSVEDMRAVRDLVAKAEDAMVSGVCLSR